MTIQVNLGGLGPFVKAITPALMALLAAGMNTLIQGHVDKQSLVIAATGLAAAIITFLVPNAPKAPAGTPPPAA